MIHAVLALCAVFLLAEEGRAQKARIYIRPGGCGTETVRTFYDQVPGGWLKIGRVRVGDCVTLPARILEGFRLCCPGTQACVKYAVPVPKNYPVQCVSNLWIP